MEKKLCDPGVIKTALAAGGFRFDKRKGQNFLTASWVPERMAALIGKDRHVLEIGPGFGALTSALADTCSHVTAIEKDKLLIPILRENLSSRHNITLIEGDALKLDLAPLEAGVVCSNLPYSITTPILTRLIGSDKFEDIIVMVQKEVARRMTARPGTAEYGALTVFTALHASASVVFDIPPVCFIPRPTVTSSVIHLRRIPLTGGGLGRREQALRISRAAFSQRRKTLLNALSAGLALPREAAAACLEQAGIDPMARGETLSPDQFLILAKYI
jgi:16S rRNA (adenine1518-N6/adenine1519-N6)-dimethyltransferase